jgi:hypothetical protein
MCLAVACRLHTNLRIQIKSLTRCLPAAPADLVTPCQRRAGWCSGHHDAQPHHLTLLCPGLRTGQTCHAESCWSHLQLQGVAGVAQAGWVCLVAMVGGKQERSSCLLKGCTGHLDDGSVGSLKTTSSAPWQLASPAALHAANQLLWA